MTEYVLVCEGQCGGQATAAYDVICRADASDPSIPRLARALVHTSHVEVREHLFSCVICGHVRRFGGTPLSGDVHWTRTGPQRMMTRPDGS